MSQDTPSYKRRHLVKGIELRPFSEQYPEFGELCRREDHEGIDRWLEETEFVWDSESFVPIAMLDNVIERGRWETTPDELKAENKRLREMTGKLALALSHLVALAEADADQSVIRIRTPMAMIESMQTLVREAAALLLRGKTD